MLKVPFFFFDCGAQSSLMRKDYILDIICSRVLFKIDSFVVVGTLSNKNNVGKEFYTRKQKCC